MVLGFTAWTHVRPYSSIRPTQFSCPASPDLQKLEAAPSDSVIGELHVAAIWTAHVAADGEGWSHLQVLQVPETDFQ